MATFDYEKLLIDIPDYPEPGVVFKDVTPLIASPQGLAAVVDDIATHFMGRKITKVVGTEARGFLLGAPVAYRLGVGFVPARKPNKLPRAVFRESYSLEYGVDVLEMHQDALTPDDNVLIVDDLVATAGTAIATAKLCEAAGANLVGFAFLLELEFLYPRKIIKGAHYDQEVYSLIKVANVN